MLTGNTGNRIHVEIVRKINRQLGIELQSMSDVLLFERECERSLGSWLAPLSEKINVVLVNVIQLVVFQCLALRLACELIVFYCRVYVCGLLCYLRYVKEMCL